MQGDGKYWPDWGCSVRGLPLRAEDYNHSVEPTSAPDHSIGQNVLEFVCMAALCGDRARLVRRVRHHVPDVPFAGQGRIMNHGRVAAIGM